METLNELKTKGRLLIKVAIIGVIILLLMIPSWQVQNLIVEREERQKEAVAEVSGRWAGPQTIAGPVLVLPYLNNERAPNGSVLQAKRFAFFLPDTVDIQSKALPEERHRGIYKVMLYAADLRFTGSFGRLNLAALRIDPAQVLWQEAYLRLQVGDLRGLREGMTLRWNDSARQFAPNRPEDGQSTEALMAPLHASGLAELEGARFSGTLALNGSQQLLFAPQARKSSVALQSPWPHPSFTGEGLPQASRIGKDGFTARWQTLSYRRTMPQQFTDAMTSSGSAISLSAGAVGVDLFVPVNAYQKTLRSVKYALLCIVLTFAAFFLIELIHKKPVHPLQYGLIGLALILFYALLLSISEYIGFNPAYAIAAAATIGLIGWFVRGVLQSGRLSTLLASLLVLLYGYLFTILQLQDFALLLGSLGLFVTLAVIMHFTRRISW